ncbi:MAG: radical SAM protein [Treponema sp.]|nr:radical SAM protein [Treponema sp.]
MYAVSFYTLGCKLNQLETEAAAEAFREEGFTLIPWDGPEKPALFILNTCTVTSRAEQKARRIIRLFLRSPCAVLVTGCYAQLEREALAALDPAPGEADPAAALFVLPGGAKEALLDLPRYLARNAGPGPDASPLPAALSRWFEERERAARPPEDKAAASPPAPFRFNPRAFSFHSRAFLKIQDGCDRSCAYCRVPLARGKAASLASAEVLARLRALEREGLAEAVLTGVSICQYRDPADPRTNLPALLRLLLDNTRTIALRLSSVEPEPAICTGPASPGGDDFFAILAHPRIRNHFHLSVQSGSDRILAAMGRPYRAGDIAKTVERLRRIKGDPFLACDIITGFPGETGEDFAETAALCGDLDFAGIHGFPYSPRPGTRAAAMADQVCRRLSGERLRTLLELARRGRRAYVSRWLGKTVEAVAETAAVPSKSGTFPGLTDNYLRAAVTPAGNTPAPRPGSAFHCHIAGEAGRAGFDIRGAMILDCT